MNKIPKLPVSKYHFVIKINSEKKFDEIFNICSDWLKDKQDKYFGFYCMNYGKSEPRLKNTMFFIWRIRNKKDKAENTKLLKEWMASQGFIYIECENGRSRV